MSICLLHLLDKLSHSSTTFHSMVNPCFSTATIYSTICKGLCYQDRDWPVQTAWVVVEQEHFHCAPWAMLLTNSFLSRVYRVTFDLKYPDYLEHPAVRYLSPGSWTLRSGSALSFQAYIFCLPVVPPQKETSELLITIQELAEMGRVFPKHSRHFISCLFSCVIFCHWCFVCFSLRKQVTKAGGKEEVGRTGYTRIYSSWIGNR